MACLYLNLFSSIPLKPVRIIMDTDTFNEIDDQFALIYALLSPDCIQIEAVHAAPFRIIHSVSAEDGMEKSHQEIIRIIQLLGKSNISSFRGSCSYIMDVKKPIESAAADDLIKKALQSPDDDPLYWWPSVHLQTLPLQF